MIAAAGGLRRLFSFVRVSSSGPDRVRHEHAAQPDRLARSHVEPVVISLDQFDEARAVDQFEIAFRTREARSARLQDFYRAVFHERERWTWAVTLRQPKKVNRYKFLWNESNNIK